MKKYLSWLILGGLVLVGMAVTIYVAVEPRAVPKIKFSQFINAEAMSAALLQRLRLEITGSQVLFLGIQAEEKEHYVLVNDFIQRIQSEIHPLRVAVDPHLPHKSMISYQDEIDLKSEPDRFVEGVRQSYTQKVFLVVIVPSLYASYLLSESPVSKLEKETQLRGTSFIFSKFPRSRDEESRLYYPCVSEDRDHQGSSPLGCMILNQARLSYRKKDVPGKKSGLAYQVGLSEYLVLLN